MIIHLFFGLCLVVLGSSEDTKTVQSWKELGELHCQQFPIDVILRLATGTLSEQYGEEYFDYDCYVRQFIREDGLGMQVEDDEDEQEDSEDDSEGKEEIPDVDPIVVQYAEGLKKCLPDRDAVKSVYAMWRFYRYVVQHDYALEWMRAKIRSGLGYEAEKPNAWMDGELGAARLRLEKLFSNQFYEYLDTLMFKDFLYPIITFLRQNTVLAISSELTESGKPILVQIFSTHNYLEKVFLPVVLSLPNQSPLFSFTIPGIPLLLSGSNSKISWAFTGVLVDRSNIEQIETVGNKFYHHDTEQWITLQQEQINIIGNKTCKFMHSIYGSLYTKQERKGKVSEYISRWHENEGKVRNIFTDLHQLIRENGILEQGKSLEFPFNSIMLANQTGIFQYLCPQKYPSYFLYPDMFGEPEQMQQRWVSGMKKKYMSVSNTHLTTTNQASYLKHEHLSPTDEQIAINMRSMKVQNLTPESALSFLQQSLSTIPHIKKQKDMMMTFYRKVKFIYLPDEPIRKQCDQLISMLEKWDHNLSDSKYAPIYILWDYFMREYTFNYISASQYGASLPKHKVLTHVYWVGQMGLWSKGTSYGECDSHEYEGIRAEVNGTGHNSSCYFNILRAINTTRQIIFHKYQHPSEISLEDFAHKQILQLSTSYKGTHLDQAFLNHYSNNLMLSAQIRNNKILYSSSYKEKVQVASLQEQEAKKESENTDL